MKLLAPNGNKSNLNEVQYHLVRTPAFKAWFGDWENSPETASKVVDYNGEPLPVYHGTNSEPFVVFYDGSFFTDDYMNADGYASGEMIYEVFLNIKKPLIINARGRKWDNLKNKYGNSTRDIASELDTDKYDGVIFNHINDNWFDDEMGDTQNVYFSINPKQIKLADGTNTTFDSNNADIRYSGGGETPYVSDDFQIGYDGAYEHLIAPNGKLSNLAPKQYHLVRTPEFKAWFGFWDLYGKSKNYYDYGVREIAIALKSEKEYAIKEAVEFLSSQVTKDDVLIPMPSRIGIATDTKKLAEEIAKKTGAKMFNCLVGIERDSIYELKKSNKNVTKFDFKFELNCEIPKARNYFIVDNVIGTGITMKNALQQVIKNLGVVNVNPLVYAIDVKNISKVVDDNGEPMVVYHGTRNNFYIFDIKKGGESNSLASVGFWFSPLKSFAQNFAESIWYGEKDNFIIQDVFLSIKNPKIFTTETDNDNEKNNLSKKIYDLDKNIRQKTDYWNGDYSEMEVFRMATNGRLNDKNFDYYSNRTKNSKEAIKDGFEVAKLWDEIKKLKSRYNDLIYSDSYEKLRTEIHKIEGGDSERANTGGLGMSLRNGNKTILEYKKSLISKDYDGLIIEKTRFDSKSAGGINDQYVALYPEQIKLADGTNTTFDSNNADIRYAKGGIIVGENEENNKFPTFDEAYELIEDSINNQGNSFLDESGDGMFDDKEKANKYVKEIYDFLLDYYDMGMIPIYRGLMADEVDLESYSIGESWSLSLDSARNFATHLGGKRKDLKIISAYVPKGNVDWEGAFTLYPLFSDFGDSDSEFELPVPANNKLYNVEVADFNNKFKNGGLITKNYLSNKLKRVKFNELPYSYKVGIIIWMVEGDKVNWSIDTGFITGINRKTLDWKGKDKHKLDVLINDYAKKYGNKKFSFGKIPAKIIIKNLEEITGEDYSKGYYKKGSLDYTKHTSILPIIIDIDDEFSPFISDGWHRFSYYIREKISNIPVVSFELGGAVRYKNGGLTMKKPKAKLLAPNGKPSNLTPEQYILVRTPAFKAWFGDWENSPETASKVVDENGEPLVVYHGTNKDINKFIPSKIGFVNSLDLGDGFYFTQNIKDAEMFARGAVKKRGGVEKTIPVFLNLKDPLDFNSKTRTAKEANELWVSSGSANEIGCKINLQARKYRYDGIIRNRGEIVAFHANQIKLADGTNTTFDSNNPDIRYAEGGSIPDLLSSQEVEDKLGRELHWWNDDIVYLSGIEYKKVYLRHEYKKV